MKFPATFKQALVLHLLAVTVLPILLLGVAGFQYFTNKHLESISNLLDTHAENVSNEASEFLSHTSTLLYTVAEMIGHENLHGQEKINRYLQIALEQSGSFESIYVLDEQRKVVHLALAEEYVSNYEDFLGLDMSSHGLFKDSSGEAAGPTWSDTFLSSITVQPSISLAIPINGGMLLGTVSLQKLSAAMVARLGDVSHDFNFSLLDHQGVIIADSRPGLTSQRLNLRMYPEVREVLDLGGEVTGGLHEDSSIMESIRLVPETGWVAYVSLPLEAAMQELRPLRYLLILVLSLATLLGALLSFGLSRHMLRPIVRLRDATAEVSRGNYEQTLPPVWFDELEGLSGSFLEMLNAIKDREESLTVSQGRYRELVNSIDGIVWELELENFRFTFVSDQSERILGYPARRWLEEETFWQDHIHSDDRDWVLSYCATEAEAQRDHDFEYRMIAADGQIVWLKDIVSVTLENGRPVRLGGVMLDVTSRKKAEVGLVETAERMQLLIDRMPFGFILSDGDHLVKLWNPAAEKIFGYFQDEVMGRNTYDFLIPADQKAHVERVLQRLEDGDLLSHSINKNKTKDGTIITCEWHNTPLQNSDGSRGGTISMVTDVTQRIKAEDALKESEERFRMVFDTNPDAVLISRASDGQIVSVNDYCAHMSGYSREELIGKTSLNLGLWVDLDQREHYLNTVKDQGEIENFEMKLRLKNGRERIGLASARILMLNDEPCILNVIRDITEMKEAEKRMMRSESRFRSLVSVMGEGILILGFNGEIVQCNQAAERILKHSAAEMVGKLHDELDHDAISEDGQPFSEDDHPAAHTLKTGEPVVNQVMGLPQDDGEVVWVQVNAHALGLDKHGKPTAVVVSFADVTGLKTIESELRNNEQHLQALSRQFQGVLEAIPDRILILDHDMRVVWLNWPEDSIDPDEDLVNQDVRCYELPGVNCGPQANLGSPLCDNCPVKRSFNSGRTESAQKELSDGRTLSLRTFPVFNEQGEVVNVIEIAQDISDSLQQQAQTMRTAQLAALGELAAGVAHEINNPINGVINYAQLILNKALAESREKELSERIIRESERIATIVRELLYFSREESQEVDQITVNEALQDALALTLHQMNKEGVVLQLLFPEDLPMVQSRSHQIQRLFLNLISNARYALNEKYPDADENKILRVSGTEVERNGKNFVRVIFRDHGVGIPENLLERILNPFVTTKPSSEGTGLGLSISHEIVQKHGGELNIKSTYGEFTEVVVDLPAKKLM